jgi:hypothetical protein
VDRPVWSLATQWWKEKWVIGPLALQCSSRSLGQRDRRKSNRVKAVFGRSLSRGRRVTRPPRRAVSRPWVIAARLLPDGAIWNDTGPAEATRQDYFQNRVQQTGPSHAHRQPAGHQSPAGA